MRNATDTTLFAPGKTKAARLLGLKVIKLSLSAIKSLLCLMVTSVPLRGILLGRSCFFHRMAAAVEEVTPMELVTHRLMLPRFSTFCLQIADACSSSTCKGFP